MSPWARQLRDLMQSHGPALVLYARQWCHCPDDALQEALLEFSQLQTAPRDTVGWLFRTVRCRAMNLSRSERRRDHYQRLAAQQRDAWFEHDPVDAIQSSELEPLLAELDPTDRQIVVARIWGNMSFEQISELVNVSVSTAHRRYQQSLQMLEQRLSGIAKKN